MEKAKLRAWWWHRQGLDGALAGKGPVEVLEQSGWARSVGGVGPYLTLFSRGGIGRAVAEAAAARLEIHELPSARGCTYVLPAADFALGLRAGQEFFGDLQVAAKLGVTEKEVDALCTAVRKALEGGPLDPEGIRQATGNAARNLGEAGKKKGMITTLPLALGKLQAEGEIRRVPVNGRFDQQRYQYVLWRPNPLAGFAMSPDEAYVELARRYFRWIGPATLAELQGFLALSGKKCKAAIEPLGLVPLEAGSDRLLFPEDRESFHAFAPPEAPQYALVSSIDALLLLRRDTQGLIEEADRERQVAGDKALVSVGGLKDLPATPSSTAAG